MKVLLTNNSRVLYLLSFILKIALPTGFAQDMKLVYHTFLISIVKVNLPANVFLSCKYIVGKDIKQFLKVVV